MFIGHVGHVGQTNTFEPSGPINTYHVDTNDWTS